jgi:hypothetical protein
MNYKNKRAQAEYTVIFVYRFIIILLIVGVFVGVVWYRFSTPYDVRQLEAASLAKESVECMTSNSVLELGNFNQETLKKCVYIDEKNIYYLAKFQLPNEEKNISIGKTELYSYCKAEESNVKGTYLPSCFSKNYNVLYGNKLNEISIFIAIDKNDKNVK